VKCKSTRFEHEFAFYGEAAGKAASKATATTIIKKRKHTETMDLTGGSDEEMQESAGGRTWRRRNLLTNNYSNVHTLLQ
jgi:hypothetical protein